MEAVDILGGVDGQQHGFRVDALRQRQLDENAVDAGIGIEPGDEGQKLGLAGRDRQAVLLGTEPRGIRLAALVADIDLARRILADQHHGEARGAPLGRLEGCGAVPDLIENAGGDGLAVDTGGGHGGQTRIGMST